MGRVGAFVVLFFSAALLAAPTALADYPEHGLLALKHRHAGGGAAGGQTGVVARNFEVLGHNDLGNRDTNGDVWVHGNFAYVGTWAAP